MRRVFFLVGFSRYRVLSHDSNSPHKGENRCYETRFLLVCFTSFFCSFVAFGGTLTQTTTKQTKTAVFTNMF